MKFSFEWLKFLTSTKISPQKISELLTIHFSETKILKRGSRYVLDIDVLPDRIADASSHLGVAREIAAIEGGKFEYPQVKIKEDKRNINEVLEVEIKTKKCFYYVSRVIFNIQVKESPNWLKERLKDCGIRPINNLVDAANYIMLLTGQPLHIFDFDKVDPEKTKKRIIVRQAKDKEKILTLDNKEYELNKEITVIASSKDLLAIAGIKGGKIAEVDKTTKNIILESANFDGYSIKKASKFLSLKTDASYRFEHNLPIELAEYAIDLLVDLILKVSSGEVLKGKIKKGIDEEKNNPLLIEFRKIEKFLGISLGKKEILKIFDNLGFSIIKKTKNYLLMHPPFLRKFNYQEEVIGEIARIKDFNKLPSLPPYEKISLPPKNEDWDLKIDIKNWLKGLALEEVYNYSFISKKEGELWSQESEKLLISLINPISDNFYYLRPTILFNFLKNIKDNFRFYDNVRLFEIGKIYYWKNKEIYEEEVFSGVLAAKKGLKEEDLFYEGKGILESLFEKFGLSKEGYLFSSFTNKDYLDLLENGGEILNNSRESIGIIGWPKEEIKSFYDLKNFSIAFWEIKLKPLKSLILKEIDYSPLPLYPAIVRDISFFVKKNIFFETILSTIQNSGVQYLEDVDLFDIYEPEGENKSLSFHLIFRSKKKTLTTQEVDREMKKIIKSLEKIGAKIR